MSIKKTNNDRYVSTKPNLTIVTFDDIFDLVVIHTINNIYNIYGSLEPIHILNLDTRRIILNILLEQIYKRMILEKSHNNILYINTSFTTKFSEIWTYIEIEKLEQFIIKTCKSISKNAPLPIYVEAGNIDLLNDCGETKEVLHKLEHTLSKFKDRMTSLSKLKKYCKTNGLMQFVDKYHHTEDIKNDLFYHKYLKGVNDEQI